MDIYHCDWTNYRSNHRVFYRKKKRFYHAYLDGVGKQKFRFLAYWRRSFKKSVNGAG